MFEGQEINKAHGSPYDRGSADSWYGRGKNPHWYPAGTYNGEAIKESEMSAFEVYCYNKGFDENEADTSLRKDWGQSSRKWTNPTAGTRGTPREGVERGALPI